MEALTAGLIAELACSATSWLEMERQVVDLLERDVGADTVFFLDRWGPTATCRGVLAEKWTQLRSAWPKIEKTPSPSLLLQAALAQDGVVVDSELFGTTLRDQPYYHLFMAPVRGYTTLFGVIGAGSLNVHKTMEKRHAHPGGVLGEVVLGRCVGSRPFSRAQRERLGSILPTLSLAHRAFHPIPGNFAQTLLAGLTAREQEVVSYLHLGYTNREIGVALGTKERTVRNQLSQIYEKLGVSGRAEAVGLVR